MNRRGFLSGGVSVAISLNAGCISSGAENRQVSNNPSYPADDHSNHIDALTIEIDRRGIEVRDIERRGASVVVDYETENLNDDLAEVAMAFVERIDGGWGIEGLDAIARSDTAWAWHADAGWAQEYLDGEIDATEYGQRISGTLERTLVLEGDENGSSA